MDYLSGAFSGFVQNIIGYPLDTIKILQQNKMNYKLIKNTNYYNGICYPLISNIITNSIVFKFFKDYQKITDNAYLSGFISGALSTPIVFLLDSLKIRSQTNNKSLNIKSIIINNGKITTLLCESSALCLYFGNYKQLIEYNYSPFMAGGISGTVNWLIGFPIDVIKTRQITFNISIKEAIKMGSFHKGLSICLIRAFLVNSCGFYSYELCENYLNNY